MKHLVCLFLAAILSFSLHAEDDGTLLILHTSDTHSCVEPVSVNYGDTATAGKGGFMRRAALTDSMRREHPDNMLLFDCGDFSQGSAYYNLYKGEVEVRLMNLMGYDACTLGNHEFDFGLDNLARLLRMADFPFVCCNYSFTGTPCEGLVKPYIVVERAGMRIGIFGVSPQPAGLITGHNYEGMRYVRPAKAAQPVIDCLRSVEKCDVVVCLSHLGWGEEEDMDVDFIRRTTGLDVLLGGHTHTYFAEPRYVKDKNGHEVLVDHQGKNGRYIGAVTLSL